MSFDYAAYRAEKFVKANPTLLKSLTEPLEKQLAEKDAEIAELRKKNDELTNCLMVEQQENADHIAEIAALKAKVDARTDPGAEAPAKTTRRKNAK